MIKKSKILVVDDDPDIVEILRYNLSLEGYDVKTASNGKECLKKVKNFIPHIILLDVMTVSYTHLTLPTILLV